MMTPGAKNLLLTVLLAIAAAAAGAFLCANYVIHRNAQHSSLHEMVHRDLKLTSQQSTRIDQVEVRFTARRKALEAAIRAANGELAAAIQESHGDSPRVRSAIDRVHHEMGTLQKETVSHIFQMRAILTPQQAVKFDSEVVEALTDEGR